jgi:hypothetical protein
VAETIMCRVSVVAVGMMTNTMLVGCGRHPQSMTAAAKHPVREHVQSGQDEDQGLHGNETSVSVQLQRFTANYFASAVSLSQHAFLKPTQFLSDRGSRRHAAIPE